LSFPNSEELFHHELIDRKTAFDILPPSEKTINIYREWFNKRDHAHYSNEQTIERMMDNPTPMTEEEDCKFQMEGRISNAVFLSISS